MTSSKSPSEEIKLEKEETADKPIIIETRIIQHDLFPCQIKREAEDTINDDEYDEIEILDEYIEEVRSMHLQTLKMEIKEEPELVSASPVAESSRMNLRGVKINLNKMLGTRSYKRSKALALKIVDPSTIDVPNCFNTSNRPFKCKKCPLSFKIRRDLSTHRAIHKKADFWCKKCGQKFRFQSSFFHHDCDFWCSICGKAISNKANLKIHLSYVHGVGEAKLFYCDFCGNTYKSKRNIDTHMKNHMESTPFNCAICNKGFSHAGALKIHMWNHRDMVNCEICMKRFKPRSLYYHIKRCRLTHEDIGQPDPNVITVENVMYKVVEPKPIYVIKIKNEAERSRNFIHVKE